MRLKWPPNDVHWWILVAVAVLIVFAWPPGDDRSLAVKTVNWAVDPRHYDELYLKGGWTRTRLELRVVRDPFNPATARQILTAVGVVSARPHH
jgi:hypothetical protein